MSEQVIVTKRGIFGRVQVTIPMNVKNTMMLWCRKSGMGKAEFFRAALMIGVSKLAESVDVKQPGDTYSLNEEIIKTGDRLDVRKPVAGFEDIGVNE